MLPACYPRDLQGSVVSGCSVRGGVGWLLAPARTFFNGRLAFLKKTRPWHSLKADEVCCDSPRSRSRGPSGVPAWRRQRAAQRHQRSSPLFLVDEPAGCSTRTKGKEMEAGRQAGRQADRQAAGRQAGGRASPSVTQEADEEFTRSAKSCCMYIQQPRESHSLLEGGADGVHAAMCHWEDARPAASSAMATSATARSSANNRQQTPPPPPNSNSIHRECAVCN